MKHLIVLLFIIPSMIPAQAMNKELVNTSRSPYVRMRNVDLDTVRWTEGFWAEKFELCRKAMLPSVQQGLLDPRNSEHLINFKIAAGLEKGPRRSVAWSDGDCYKWLEAVALVYEVTRDPKLDRMMDDWINIIAKAQAPDGYIATQTGNDTANRLKMPHIHELYCMGHLLTAACIHHRVTGKDNFLRIAHKTADYLYEQFQPRPPRLVHFPWNPSAYMGLIELYRTTREKRYLELAQILIDNRGSSSGGGDHRNGGTDQTQDRVPFRNETQAVGHAVCATYLYCGAADLFAETGENALLEALRRIWLNATTRRMYITGAVGSGGGVSERGDPLHEAFRADYELPNRSAYCETCSNIGNAMWNWRMLALTGDAKYADVMERVLYNSMLSAVSTDGTKFFYCNPLKWTGEETGPHKHHTAQRWSVHSCYCCPPQVARTIAGLSGWAYSVSKEEVWVHLYSGSTLATKLPNGTKVSLKQETKYPWDGHIAITFRNTPDKPIYLKLRIPGWAEQPVLKINEKDSQTTPRPGSYTTLKRKWSAGDKIELELPLKVRMIEANPKVANLRNYVAFMRGPIVYCLELPEKQNGKSIWDKGIFLPENVRFDSHFDRNRFGGITILTGRAMNAAGKKRFARGTKASISSRNHDWTNQLYRTLESDPPRGRQMENFDIELIPYFTWANRGVSWMEVWIPLAR
ncbi:MAG: glycoside hydrolase family 127 protein [Planctomycetota bacterium]